MFILLEYLKPSHAELIEKEKMFKHLVDFVVIIFVHVNICILAQLMVSILTIGFPFRAVMREEFKAFIWFMFVLDIVLTKWMLLEAEN